MVARRRLAGLRRGERGGGRALRHRRSGPPRAGRPSGCPTRAPGGTTPRFAWGSCRPIRRSGRRPRRSWVDWDRERYPYLCRVLWDSERAPLALLVQSRDQREVALLAVDSGEGATRTLLRGARRGLGEPRPRPAPLVAGRQRPALGQRAVRSVARWSCAIPRAPSSARSVRPIEGFLSLCHVTPDAGAIFVLEGGPVGNSLARIELAVGPARRCLTDDAAEHAPVFAAGRPALGGHPDRSRRAAPQRGGEPRAGRAGRACPTWPKPPPFDVQLELVETADERRASGRR